MIAIAKIGDLIWVFCIRLPAASSLSPNLVPSFLVLRINVRRLFAVAVVAGPQYCAEDVGSTTMPHPPSLHTARSHPRPSKIATVAIYPPSAS